MTNVRLGRLSTKLFGELTEKEKRLVRGAFGASADAIVLLPDKAAIIECKIRDDPGSIEGLTKYEILFKETDECKQWWNKPIELILLTPLDNPFYEKLCEKFGIKVVQYKPAWIYSYLDTYPRRYSRGKLYGIEFPEK